MLQSLNNNNKQNTPWSLAVSSTCPPLFCAFIKKESQSIILYKTIIKPDPEIQSNAK